MFSGMRSIGRTEPDQAAGVMNSFMGQLIDQTGFAGLPVGQVKPLVLTEIHLYRVRTAISSARINPDHYYMTARFHRSPHSRHYDIVIVGGAMYGSAVAWFLMDNPDFNGSVLVVEQDPTYAMCSTTHTNSCIRQQFSNEINVRISQFGAEYIRHFGEYLGNDSRVPEIILQNFGYLYLADNDPFAEVLRKNRAVQIACGADTRILNRSELRAQYPFFHLEDIVAGSLNTKDEGYFDGHTLFDWWRRTARERGGGIHRQPSRGHDQEPGREPSDLGHLGVRRAGRLRGRRQRQRSPGRPHRPDGRGGPAGGTPQALYLRL